MSLYTLDLLRSEQKRIDSLEDRFYAELGKFTTKDLPPIDQLKIKTVQLAGKNLVVKGEWGEPGKGWHTATITVAPGAQKAAINGYKSATAPSGGATGVRADGELTATDTKTALRKAAGAIDAGLVPASRELRAAIARARVA